MNNDYKKFCAQEFNRVYDSLYEKQLEKTRAKDPKLVAERYAQKEAIKESFKSSLNKYSPKIEAADLWHAIYVAYLKKKSGLSGKIDMDDAKEEIIEKVVSAAQSWKSASGHVFESFICESINPLFEKSGDQHRIKFILQKELNDYFKNNMIGNSPEHKNWLRKSLDSLDFDVYAITEYAGLYHVFGCIQTKTSIRERVSRDREPSQEAMDHEFWSIAIVLDGEFLSNPKYIDMVNGGQSYKLNGWHGMYTFSSHYANDRIYPIGEDFKILISHAIQAAGQFMSRGNLKNDWKAKI